MDLVKLETILTKHNEPPFRLEQIRKAVFKDGIFSFSEISTIPLDLRKTLDEEMKILSFTAQNILLSKDKASEKAVLVLRDNNKIETVLLHSGAGNYTICLSTQAGCPLNCQFCATGQGGFKRNLTAEEITDQVLFWKAHLRATQKIKNISFNIVFMGMGEPLINWVEVKKSLGDLVNPKLFGVASRNISVSTVGVRGKIVEFARAFPQINLAISLHFTDDKKRDLYMPANRSFGLDDIKEDLKKYFKKNNRQVFIEYILFDDINDTVKDAENLADYLESIGHVYLFCVNLIGYNFTSADLKPSPQNRIVKFKNILMRRNINVTIRKSLGADIAGACGQLTSAGAANHSKSAKADINRNIN